MSIRPRTLLPLLLALGIGVQLVLFGIHPAAALTQTISIRPTSGSARQLITVTFVADACSTIEGPDQVTWDGHGFGLLLPKPPSCKTVFPIVPLDGYQNPGRHKVCGVTDVTTCTTYTILAPKPKATPKPTPKTAPSSTGSPSPSSAVTATPTAIALETATPTPAPAPPTTPVASSAPDQPGADGAAADLTFVWIGGAILLGLLVGVVIGAVRRARVVRPPR